MRVKNNWNRPIRVGRQIIPKGAVEDIPEHLLLQPRVQKLRKDEKLIFPFWDAMPEAPKATKAEPAAPAEPEADDLTTLAHIGESQQKVLRSFGVFTFQQLIEHRPTLHKILEISKQQAHEIVEDAKKKVG
jgi:hypothetical protein